MRRMRVAEVPRAGQPGRAAASACRVRAVKTHGVVRREVLHGRRSFPLVGMVKGSSQKVKPAVNAVSASVTHVSVGSLVGIGIVTRKAHWKSVGQIVLCWLITLPCGAALATITALRVFIRGDENARPGRAIAVLDETRKLGIAKVTFKTRPKP